MSLQSLGVGHNRLTSLPAEVALLTRLTWLGLDGNPLIIPTARSAARDAPRLGPNQGCHRPRRRQPPPPPPLLLECVAAPSVLSRVAGVTKRITPARFSPAAHPAPTSGHARRPASEIPPNSRRRRRRRRSRVRDVAPAAIGAPRVFSYAQDEQAARPGPARPSFPARRPGRSLASSPPRPLSPPATPRSPPPLSGPPSPRRCALTCPSHRIRVIAVPRPPSSALRVAFPSRVWGVRRRTPASGRAARA